METHLIPLAIGSGVELKDWILLVAGNVFIVVLAVRAVGYYAKREWGEMLGHLVAGIIVAGLVYATDQSIGILRTLWGMIAGGA